MEAPPKCNEVGNKERWEEEWGEKNQKNNTAFPRRGVYLRFEDLNASAVVPPRATVGIYATDLIAHKCGASRRSRPPPLPPTFASLECVSFFFPTAFTFRFALF